MVQSYQDAMAICRSLGHPDLFVTFTTANPQRPEVTAALSGTPWLKPIDRPDIVARVFKLPLKELLNDIKAKKIFGNVVAACWRIFEFHLQYKNPPVERLQCHLENQQTIVFSDMDSIYYVLARPSAKRTVLIAWFEANELYLDARELTYVEFPKSFYDLKTINGTHYDTYKTACMALGLLEDDNEWNHALMEASIWATGQKMHDIFASILLFNEVANPHDFWQKHWTFMLAFDKITKAVDTKEDAFFFVHGSGGTALTSKLRSTSKIVLLVATSGIASLLLPGGRTAHSRFKIPIDLHESSICSISHRLALVELLQATDLIKQLTFEAFDRTMKDLMKSSTLDATNKPFGGKTVVLGDDFRQILPMMILKGSRENVIFASLQRSHLWSRNVGNGNITGVQIDEFREANSVPFPPDLLVADEGRGVRPLVERIFPNIVEMIGNQSYLCERAILAPTNDEVDDINAHNISLLPGDIQTYLSI
ncbi:PREDICTED: uncharacterized protein LOC104596665 [Nelumbo nucifera]|uniref:ATP-dependent DNA helicase n=1 Tax=Nelumbo nucifera TaxID=4432 RepID=A0A1U7ZRW1_NELNU|nr:PREDICTED: uncharacterized protein LOC104596665 [Nelumbo nucifera]